MTPTELAHWRYRVKALEAIVAEDQAMTFLAMSSEKRTFTDYLLEEAKYMSELGAITRE